jgi:FtsP/CotA-like multicopper oxidase with cupredoxin domain
MNPLAFTGPLGFLLSLLLIWNAILPADASKISISQTQAPWAPTTVLVISRKNISADCTIRPSVTINGTFPGPELRFKAGQKLWIRVINELEDETTTIHFHGLAQFGSPFADGTVKISQVIDLPMFPDEFL